MKSIHKVLRRDIGEVTETALMRKSEVQLKDLEKSLKKKKSRTLLSRIGLRNRVGCIFLEIGDESIQI
jgi:hypothetical protein